MRSVRIDDTEVVTVCGKGTRYGAAAEASRYQFAACVLNAGHRPPCDSGPAPEPEPTERAA